MRHVFFKERGFLRGFTIAEMLTTLGVIAVLTVMVLGYSRQSESITNLLRESDRLIFTLRRAQALSMLSLKEENEAICGWGIYFDKSNNQYLIFKDLCSLPSIKGNQKYDPASEKPSNPEDIATLLKGVELRDTNNIKSVTFVPPDPSIVFDPSLATEAPIRLCLISTNRCVIITINQIGLITKQQEL